MTSPIENILDQTLSALKNGSSIEEAISRWPAHRDELLSLLQIVDEISGLPKTTVPQPLMKRKYEMPLHKSGFWNSLLHISRFATVSMAIFMFISGLSGAAYAAWFSLPGQTLFPLKKTAEQIQLRFATSDVEKATIQMNIAQKRLEEAERIFSNSDDLKLQSAALNELSSQTQATAEAVKTAAVSSAITKQDHPIVKSLENISQKQQTFISQITPDKMAQAEASANNTNKEVKEIKQIIQLVAATNDAGTLAQLNSDPSEVIISGTVTKILKTGIIVENTQFTYSETTSFQDISNNKLNSEDLKNGDKVTILGSKDSSLEKLMAKKIVLLITDPSAIQSTSSPTVVPQTQDLQKSTTTSSTPTNLIKTQITPAAETTEIPPSQAIGTFIPEDPAPQFQ